MAQLTLHYIRDTSRRELLPPRATGKAEGPFLSCPSPPSTPCAPAQPRSGQGPASARAARRLPGSKARPGRAAGESLMRNELEQNL